MENDGEVNGIVVTHNRTTKIEKLTKEELDLVRKLENIEFLEREIDEGEMCFYGIVIEGECLCGVKKGTKEVELDGDVAATNQRAEEALLRCCHFW